jgi:predicted MFS family arabinose efflux permease
MLIYIFAMLSIQSHNFRRPFVLRIVSAIASNLLLVFASEGIYAAVIYAALLGAVGIACVQSFVDTMVVNTIEDHCSKVLSSMFTILFAIAALFGYIGGLLFFIDLRLHAVPLTGLLFFLNLMLVFVESRTEKRRKPILE